jgi:glycosyltransferase involved in cell wall biosynthesis
MIPGLVSTIIPVHNRPQLLREAVASVLAQDWRPIEIIVVDDGSTDGTPAVARELAAANPGIVRVLRQDNAGPGAAREAGRLVAQGEFIQYLDSDDLLLPGKFSAQVRALQGDAAAGIAYGIVLDEDGRTRERSVAHASAVSRREIFPAVLQSRLWHTIGPLYRRSVCDAIGPWSTQRIFEDWDYDCRAGLLGVKLHHIAQPVAVARDGGDTHAGFAWRTDAQAMHDRIRTYVDVLAYARRAGVAPHTAEMRQFVRSMFWMAREAGARGYEPEARELFALARANSTERGAGYLAFGLAARVLGWKNASRLAAGMTR